MTLPDDGNYYDITGTTTVTSIATKGVGTVVKLHFDAALILTHNATDLVLPGSANITTAAGDEAEFVEYATGDWRLTNYQKAAFGINQGWEVIRDNVLAGASGNYDVTDLSSFVMIWIKGHVYPSVDSPIGLRTSTNNGSSYDAGASDYGYQFDIGTATTTSAGASGSATEIPLTQGNNVDNTADRGFAFDLTLYNFNKAQNMRSVSKGNYELSTGIMVVGDVGGRRNQATARDAFRLFCGSGNLTGFVTVQGWRG